jgi:pimeloyl-ACP methyl ester carboxylesterase
MHPLNRRTVVLSGLGALAATAAGISYARLQDSPMLEERWSAGGLHGNFARPRKGPERGPAVLLLQGSGAIARNGGVEELRLIAQGLAAAGIRSLRYDKRGVGESRPLVKRPEDYTLPHLVDDAAMAARDLAARPDVSEVIIAGHSEGSILATMAAQKANPAAIALLAGPGRLLHVILREQYTAGAQPGEEDNLKDVLEVIDALARGERIPVSNPQSDFRPFMQPYWISALNVDPAAELSRLTLPTLIVQCGRDLQVRRSDFDALVRVRPDARTLVLPTANHMFRAAPADMTDREANFRSSVAHAPLVPELVPGLVEFVRGVIA